MPDSPPTDPAAPADPDGQTVFEVLPQDRPPSLAEAYNAVQGIRNMSGQTVAAEIRAQNTKFDELRRENSILRWMLGLGFTVLGILIAILALVLK